MPLGILTDEQLAREIGRSVPNISDKDINKIENNLPDVRVPKVVDIKRGRGNQLEIPNEIRMLVAEEALNGAPAKALTKAFGISESSVSAYKNDATSTKSYDTPNKELAESNQTVRDQITDKARGRLISALDEITPDRIAGAKIKDIASIAKDMSVIVKNMEPDVPQNQQNVQVVIYKPRMKDEDDFDVITVNE